MRNNNLLDRLENQPLEIQANQANENLSMGSKIKKFLIYGGALFTVLGIVFAIFLFASGKGETLPFIKKSNIEFQSFKLEGSGLVASFDKKLNQIVRYHNEKNISMTVMIADEPTQRNETIKTDFLLNVFNKTVLESGDEKYSAYLVVLNMSRTNGDDVSYFGGVNLYTLRSIEELEEEEEEKDTPEEKPEGEEYKEESTTGRIIDTLPIFQFSFYKNGSVSDIYIPMDVHGFVEQTVEDIMEKVVPVISEEIFLKKTNKTKILSGKMPGEQKLYEHKGKFTTLYLHESFGVETDDLKFEGSNMHQDTKILINNEIGHVESIIAKGGALFVSENEKGEERKEEEGPIYVDTKEELKNAKDNIVENDLQSIGNNFTSKFDLISIFENETMTNVMSELVDIIEMDYETDTEWEIEDELRYQQKILRSFGMPLTPMNKDFTKIPVITSKNQLRQLKSDAFDKPVEFTYNVFKFNLVGVKLTLGVLVNANPQTGKLTCTAILGCGSSTYSILQFSTESKLGKGIARALIVINTMIDLIKNMNGEIGTNSTNWVSTITEQMGILVPYFKNALNISDTFVGAIQSVTEKIQETTGKIFTTVQNGITTANNFLLDLTNKVNSANLTEVQNILTEIAKQYYSFINSMQAALDAFHSSSLTLIANIDGLLSSISTFTVDGLFDLTEKVNKVKECYSGFAQKLLDAIPKGIDTLHDKVETAAHSVLDKILNVVKFIENAIRNNIIISLVVKKEVRDSLADTLKTFDERVNGLLSAVINKSKTTFQEAIEEGKEQSIKYKLVKNLEEKLGQFDTKSTEIVEKIKAKIAAFTQFLQFTSNLDALEDVQSNIQQEIFDKYDEHFVETIKEDKISIDMQNDDIKIELDNITNTAVNSFKGEVKKVETLLNEKIATVKSKYYNSLISRMKTFTDNIKNYKTNEFLRKFNETVDSLYTSLATVMTNNYKLGEDYVAEVISYKPKMARPALPNGFLDKYSEFLDKGGDFFDNCQDGAVTAIKDKITEILKSIRLQLVFNMTIPKDILNQPSLAFMNMVVTEIQEAIDETKEYLDDNFYDYITSTYVEMHLIKPLGDLNKQKTDSLVAKKTVLDSLEYSEGNTTDICTLVKHCKKKLWKKKCYDLGECQIVPKTTNNHKNIKTTFDYSGFKTTVTNLGNNFKTQINLDLAAIKLVIDNISKEVTDAINSLKNDVQGTALMSETFKKGILSLVNNKMKGNLLQGVYNAHKQTVSSHIVPFYTAVTPIFDKFTTDFYDKVLVKTIATLVTKPTEIVDTFNQIKNNYLKGTAIFDDLQKLIMEEINSEIQGSYANVQDVLDDINTRLCSYIPPELNSIFTSRINIINSGAAYAKQVVSTALTAVLNIDEQMTLLNTTKADIFKIKSTIDSYENQIVLKITDIYNKVVQKVNSYIDPKIPHKAFEYQMVKIREIVNFVKKTISVIVKLVTEKSFDMSNLLSGFLNKFESSLGNNLNKIVKTIKEKLDTLQSADISSILPSIKSIVNEIRDNLEASYNFEEIKHNFNIIVENLSKGLEFFKLKTLSNATIKKYVDAYFMTEYNKYKSLTSLYLDKDNYYASYEKIKDYVHRKHEEILNVINNISLNTTITNKVTKKLTTSLNFLKTKINEILRQIQTEFTFEILGKKITLSFYYEDALNEVFSSIEHSIDYSINDLVTSQLSIIKTKLIEEIEGLPDLIINTLETSFKNNLYNPLLLKHNDNSTYKLTALSSDCYNKLVLQVLDMKNNYTNVTTANNIYTYLDGQIDLMGSILELKDITENLKGGIGGLVASLELLCKDKKEFAKKTLVAAIKPMMQIALQKVMKAFTDHFGKNFIDKINRRLFINGINPIIDFIKQKITRLVNFLKNLLSGASEMSPAMKVVVKEVFPLLIAEFGDKVLTKINSYAESIVTKIKDFVSEKMVTSIVNLIKKNNLFKNEFASDVFDAIVEGLTEEVSNTLIPLVKSYLDSLNLNQLLATVKSTISAKITEITNTIRDQQTGVNTAVDNILNQTIPSTVQSVLDKVNEYKGLVDGYIKQIVFNIADTVKTQFMNFYQSKVVPILSSVTSAYSTLEGKIKEAVQGVLSKFTEAINTLKTKLNTQKIVEAIQKIKDKILSVINNAIAWINDKVHKFEDEIRKRLSLAWDDELIHKQLMEKYKYSLTVSRQRKRNLNKEDNLPAETNGEVIDLMEIKSMISKFKNFIDNFISGIKKIRDVKNIQNIFAEFKEWIKNAISKFTDPYTKLVDKIKSFLSGDILETIKSWILKEIKKGEAETEAHADALVKNGTEVQYVTASQLIECFSGLKGNTGEKILMVVKNLLNVVLNCIDPISLTKSHDNPEIPIFSYIIPIYGIPFKFSLSFLYGFKYGIQLGIRDLAIYLEAYAGAYAKIRASAGISFYVLEFGASLDGLLGDGQVGIKPMFKLFKWKVALDAYFKLEAFKFGISVFLKFPWVKLNRKKVNVLGIFHFYIWVPSFYIKELRYGGSTKAGISVEKHWVKEF